MTKEEFIKKFRRNANGLVIKFGAPIYLVGGALTEEDPTDYDIRILLSAQEQKRFFGGCYEEDRTAARWPYEYEDWEWKRGYYSLKQSRLLSRRMGVCIDLQFQSSFEDLRKLPKERLDTAPEWIFNAGLEEKTPDGPAAKVPEPGSSPGQTQEVAGDLGYN